MEHVAGANEPMNEKRGKHKLLQEDPSVPDSRMFKQRQQGEVWSF